MDELASFQALLAELNELRAFKARVLGAVSGNASGKAAKAGRPGRPATTANARSSKAGKKKTNAEMQCRATGCSNRSKGPRFGYLCEKHEAAPALDKARWKKEYAAKRANA